MSTISLPRVTPEAQGVSSSAFLAFLDAVEAANLELHSLMVVRRGSVIAEGWWAPYAPERPHTLFSLSKSFTATAAGLARADGLLTFDDKVISFFSDDLPEIVSENLATMRVRDLLTMSAGHAVAPPINPRLKTDQTWVRAFLSQPVEHEPGTHFVYSSGATYMVSAILQKLTGQTVLDYLTPRLLEPLGITGARWENSPEGINIGGWGLHIRTEDIARFGELYRCDGVWEGKRLLPEDWVKEATAFHVANGTNPDSDWAQGYGYQFWRCRHNAFRGDGAFGQFCIVMREQEAVVAITAGTSQLQAVLNQVWEHLLPAMGNDAPLPDDSAASEKLLERLAHLTIRAPEGKASSPLAEKVTERVFTFAPNEGGAQSVSVAFQPADGPVLRLTDKNGTHPISVGGNGAWREAATAYEYGGPCAASGAWTDEHTYEVKLCFCETPFTPTLTLHFPDERHVQMDYRRNVAMGPLENETLTGMATA